jgi:lipoprotein signal peptidase
MSFETILGAWVATGLTIFIFTFLYKDNPLFKLAEHLYVGISIGYTIVKTYDTVVIRLIYEPMVKQGDWSLLFPLGIGLLMLARYVPKASWLSRIAFAFVVGVGSGLAIPRVISSYVLKQIEDTVRPLVSMGSDGLTFTASILNPASNLNAIILLIGVITVLFYFFFSIEHTGPVHAAARTGVMFLMISFGAAFGYTVMARMSLLIGRLGDLIEYGSPQYGSATIILGVVTIILLILWSRRQPQPRADQPEV